LEWDAVAGGNRLQLDLQSALGALWVSNVKYRIRFDFINFSTGPSFETYLTASTTDWANDSFAENGGRWGDAPTPQDKTTINQVSFFFTLPSPTPQRFLNLGPPIAASSAAFKGLFDNVRLLQADQNAWVRADLTSLSSGSLKLLPGSKSGAYTFTVWVRDDPTADQSGTSPTHALNRFYPQGLMIQLTAKVKSGTGNDPRFFPRPSSGWTAWTKLTLPFGFDFVANDSDLGTDPALRVEFTPTETQTLDYGGRDVGSLLLASPSLQFNP
jgi:hypothetical protein